MASVEVTESVRKAWRRYCRKHGRIMKDFTSDTLRAMIRGELVEIPKPKKKSVKSKVVEEKK